MESTSYVLSFRMVFFYLVTTSWIFDISLCEDSFNQSMAKRGEKGGETKVPIVLILISMSTVSFYKPTFSVFTPTVSFSSILGGGDHDGI